MKIINITKNYENDNEEGADNDWHSETGENKKYMKKENDENCHNDTKHEND